MLLRVMEVDASGGMGEQEEVERHGEQEVQTIEQDGEKENKLEQVKKGEDEEVDRKQTEALTGTANVVSEPRSGDTWGGEAVTSPPAVASVEQASQQAAPSAPVQQNSHPQHQQLSGPRPAPTYRVVNSVIEKRDDGPGPRCGHTLTAVASVSEEGSPGYIGPRLILFGGATALEGSSAAGPQAASSGAGIRMFLLNSACF